MLFTLIISGVFFILLPIRFIWIILEEGANIRNIFGLCAGIILEIIIIWAIYGKIKENHREKALKDKSDKEQADEYLIQATYLKNGMLYEEALEVIDKGLKSNPREGTFYSMKTEILFRQGKIKEALITCDKGIKIGKKYKGTTIDIADLYGRLGNIFKQKKAYKKAINAFQKALEFWPKHTQFIPWQIETHKVIGTINWLMLQKYEEAIDAFGKIILLDSKNIQAYQAKWELLAHIEKHQEAIEVYKQIIPLRIDTTTDDEKVSVYTDLSSLFEELWNTKESKHYRKLAEKLDPKFKKKIQKYEEQIKEDEKNAYMYMLIKGQYLYMAWKLGEARDEYLSSIELRNDDTFIFCKKDTYKTLVKIYTKLWQEKEAEKYLKLAKKLS